MSRKDAFRICLFDLVWSKKNPGDMGCFLISGKRDFSLLGLYKTILEGDVRSTHYAIICFGKIMIFGDDVNSTGGTHPCRGFRLAVPSNEDLIVDGVSVVGEIFFQFSGNCDSVDNRYLFENEMLIRNCANFTGGVPSTKIWGDIFALASKNVVKPEADIPMGSSSNLELVVERFFYIYAVFWPKNFEQDKTLILSKFSSSLKEKLSGYLQIRADESGESFTLATELIISSFINEVQNTPHLVNRLTVIRELWKQFSVAFALGLGVANSEHDEELRFEYINAIRDLHYHLLNNQASFGEIIDLSEMLHLLALTAMLDMEYGIIQDDLI